MKEAASPPSSTDVPSSSAPVGSDAPKIRTDETKPETVKGIGGREFLTEEINRFKDLHISANLEGRETFDATPGKIDVDIDKLLSDETPTSLDATPTRIAFMSPVVASREGGADLGNMRLDVARIAADIQSGEELYRRAQQRIENLTGFVERAEIDFSLLNRLEPENRRLKARNRTLEKEADDAKRRVAVITADLDDHKRRLAERSTVLEQLQSKMSIAKKSLQDYERVLNQTREAADKHALTAERVQTSLNVERKENQILRNRVTELSSAVDERQAAMLEAQKMTDSLRQDAADFRAQAETVSSENIELRNALDLAHRANNQMKGEMLALHEDIRNFKTQSEFNVIAREDEMTALRGEIAELKKQLQIKDEFVRNASHDVQELRKARTAQELERERLEGIIETQSIQLDEAGRRLVEAQKSVTNFDRRYRDVATALNAQKALRESSPPADNPDIIPETNGSLTPLQALGDNLTDDEIASHLTSLKLGAGR